MSTCSTCKYEYRSNLKEPCKTCLSSKACRWEAKGVPTPEDIADKMIDTGDLGEFFRGELGAPGCDSHSEWVSIAEALIEELKRGIEIAKARKILKYEDIDTRFDLAKTQVLRDIAEHLVPDHVDSMKELARYRDENCYGGFCDDDIDASDSKQTAIIAAVQARLDAWLRCGRP